MVKCVSIRFLCLLFSLDCWSQATYQISNRSKTSTTKSQSSATYDSSQSSTQKDQNTAHGISFDVLFATNEDCDLYINDELKGSGTKNDFFYLKLPAGNYTYMAKSRTTLDELRENFIVGERATNEIFIDLLYVIDEKKVQRENLKNVAKLTAQLLVVNEKKPADLKPSDSKIEMNKDGETSVINFFIANMIPLDEGSFIMGNNKAPAADEVEHPVTISSILFSKYEVTQNQWEVLMGYNPSLNKDCPTCPVENISWEEVMKFIRKLNSISNKRFRLPTEAEWEYVAKIGGKTEIESAGGQEEYIKQTAWYFENSGKKTHPVGLKKPNISGIYDLTGNVSEWCSDWYGTYYYKEDFNQKNPEGPALGKEKIIRGGNYKDFSGDRFRPSFRTKRNPIEKGAEVGFRLVMQLN